MKSQWIGLLLTIPFCLLADGPADNKADQVRPIPPPGIPVPATEKSELEAMVSELSSRLESFKKEARGPQAALWPDVEIFFKAVRTALADNEFYSTNELSVARNLLQQGQTRLELLRQGKAPWTTQRGLVVRGYLSKIDDSVQPYGLVIPNSWSPESAHRHRLDGWFHGRGEKLSELAFLNDRMRNAGEFTPPDAFVLHPYGRYCNANKFAGEIDFLEALDHAQSQYPIDENRILVRGFSMGGAACWQFAVHYPSRWTAAAPGAGFSETPDFLKVFQSETLAPTWYEKKLWHLYDCTDYALNLFNLPTVAYSGEKDRQKQAADLMEKALRAEGIDMVHIIGPGTEHRYHPQAKEEINRRIDSIASVGRNPFPSEVRFVTWTLRYPECYWVKLEGLEHHWERAAIRAEIDGGRAVRIQTTNISRLRLQMRPGQSPFPVTDAPTVRIDGATIQAPKPGSDRSWNVVFEKKNGSWQAGAEAKSGGLAKKPGLQGPIDDAFMGPFLIVLPSGKSSHPQVERWVSSEQEHAIEQWRRQFRGIPRIKKDADVTADDIQKYNLVLWGDPESNRIMARQAAAFPIRWSAQTIQTPDANYPSDHFVPILIYPNPENPERYVVWNSGFTFREYDQLNNARQVPKLPDFAIVDVTTPPNSRWPGRVAAAGFFGESWEWRGEGR